VIAASVDSLVMTRGSTRTASQSSPQRLNLVFDPGRSSRALGFDLSRNPPIGGSRLRANSRAR